MSFRRMTRTADVKTTTVALPDSGNLNVPISS
nr:MAG TPA: hypothetical protein [Caudoviricetes sp.]